VDVGAKALVGLLHDDMIDDVRLCADCRMAGVAGGRRCGCWRSGGNGCVSWGNRC